MMEILIALVIVGWGLAILACAALLREDKWFLEKELNLRERNRVLEYRCEAAEAQLGYLSRRPSQSYEERAAHDLELMYADVDKFRRKLKDGISKRKDAIDKVSRWDGDEEDPDKCWHLGSVYGLGLAEEWAQEYLVYPGRIRRDVKYTIPLDEKKK
jgi:hypothetical protein